MLNKLLIVVFIVLAYSQISSFSNLNLLFLSSCFIAAWLNRSYINITSLIFIIALGRMIEVVFNQLTPNASSYSIFAFYALLDISVSALIAFRAPLFRSIELKFKPTINPEKYVITNADLFLGLLYSAYFVLNIIMLFEHSLRHLDDFGFEHNVWLYENARFFWDHYEHIKLPLNILEFLIVLLTVKNYMRSERVMGT